MLTHHRPVHRASGVARSSERGIVLILTLIVLVAMTLAAIAMMRSTTTSNMVVGNLAFRQAAQHSSDAGVEAAITWLENNTGMVSSSTAASCPTSNVLTCDQTAYGYLATRTDPSSSQSWADFWSTSLQSNARSLATDTAGNTVSYVIQRLCNGAGDPATASIECSMPPTATVGNCKFGSSCGGATSLNVPRQFYYRITVQVSGPRNTQSYSQAMVAM